ncbi:MAG: biopolymer transporter ExbD [Verrucomicrobia bacterium]|nr:biopolymer transporter ExbD [Verrucomicrobiota bacterium]MBS0645401.1 biopolymer transporter ExbD [Verrucomicrobiota bacterium]
MMTDLEDAEINLTPLIDVVFVILMMFIIAAPLLEQEQVSLAQGPSLTTEQAKTIESQSPIVIHVHADNSIVLNHLPVSLEQLELGLRQAYAKNGKVHPQLFQDEQASFGTYQHVKNTVAKVGFDNLDVILRPD